MSLNSDHLKINTEHTDIGDVMYWRLELGDQIDRTMWVKAYDWFHVPSGKRGTYFVQGQALCGSRAGYWLTALLNKWNAMGKDWIYTENTEKRLTCIHSMAAGRLLGE